MAVTCRCYIVTWGCGGGGDVALLTVDERAAVGEGGRRF